MQVKSKAVVLSTIRYQEKSLIVKCFTASQGLISYFVPTAFSQKKNNQRIAYFQPLTLIEIEANHKNKGSLEYFKEVRIATAYTSIPFDIKKSTIILFLSEILHHVIREEEKNTTLYLFLETALIWLDTHDEIANFHLIFLMELTKFLGFYPDNTESESSFFDKEAGSFTLFENANCLTESESYLLKKLMALKFDSNQKIFTVSERQILLGIVLDFYNIHLSGFKKPKSLDVLREVFAV